jgi:Zn-dependent M28 family amino/carboxypeptidase
VPIRYPLLAAGCLAVAFVALAAVAAEPAARPIPLRELANAVSPAELRSTITTLVGFGTRHTLSDTVSETRGIGAARRWVQRRFGEISSQCGGCLQVVTPSQVVTGPRVPKPTEVMDIVAIQRGAGDPNRVVLITGHLDSRVSDVMNATADAPGANDDASGVAAVIEAARVLSTQRFAATIVYAALSGEEQGLYGGKLLAEYAKGQGWQVEADLNNDIIGNSLGQDGVHDNSTVRVFSEGTKATETPAQAAKRRYNGGDVDSPSRNLARHMARLAEAHLTNLKVQMVYRTDRYGRGGDQVAFLDQGFPAVRVTEAHEDYTHQHQDVRVENGVRYGDTTEFVDFDYLAQVTRLNVVSLAALARAPAPPKAVTIEGAVSPDTTLTWQPVAGAASYRVWWRGTTDPQWRHHRDVPATEGAAPMKLTLKNVVIDDWFFGVSSISAQGDESPVVFPGDPGAF